MKRRLFERPDGSTAIVFPAPQGRRKILLGYTTEKDPDTGAEYKRPVYGLEPEETWYERVFARATPPDAVDVLDVEDEDLPWEHKDFIDAWVIDKTGRKPRVGMAKAREIHMNRIRAVRDEELKKLDTPYMLALERGLTAEAQAIAQQKQRLRDIPQTFDLSAAQTPEELRQMWPEELPRPAPETDEAG